MEKDKDKYSDVSTAQNMKHDIIPEEYPEGPYGSPIREREPVEGKSTPWIEGQKSISPFAYSQKDLHEHTPRQTPGAHPVPKDTEDD